MGRVKGLQAFGGALVVGLVVFVLFLFSNSGDYILLPDPAHPVAPLVRVEGGRDRADQQIFFVDVFQRRARHYETLFPWVHDGATLVPAKLIVPPGVSDSEARAADLRAMKLSQQIAAAVALRHLGYDVKAKPSGVVVAAIETSSHANGVLEPGDVITAVNGVQTLALSKLRAQLNAVKPGDTVTLRVTHGKDKPKTVSVQTIADPLRKGRAIIGFAPDQAADIELPVNVQIDAGNVGGPSAGLAFTLEVLAELGKNVTNGYKVAATGQIELDGTVAPIGGVKQKVFGVEDAGADVFLVPAGENAQEARRYADDVKVIAVKTFPQALKALAALPPKR
jgi:PDZ domain-containing protein